jgi:adenylate cyclase
MLRYSYQAYQRMVSLAERSDIVDIEVDPLTERTRRRRTLLRIGLPIGGVGLIVGALLGIEVYTDAANRTGVQSLSDTLLTGLQQRIALQVSIYLLPAERALLLAKTQFRNGGATQREGEALAFATAELAETPQIANFLFADGEGDFQLVTRADDRAPGGVTAKRILTRPDGRTVEWITWDRLGAVVSRRNDPADTFDARTRPWFIGARSTDDVFWTSAYTFFTEKVPGVTAAVRGMVENPDVIGVDIRLDELSRFLGSLSIGRTGRASIVDRTGALIAGPGSTRIIRASDGEPALANVAELGDPDLAAGWDHYRIDGPGSRVVEVGGRRLISIATPLHGAATQWLLLIAVPEAEFSGFITMNSRHRTEWSLSVMLLAVGLAVLLVRQGLRADRADRTVAERAATLRGQAAAMARMSLDACRLDAADRLAASLTEALAEATSARRVSVWSLTSTGHVLRCEDSFEPLTRGHVEGLAVAAQEAPELLAALERGEEIETADARRERRTAPLLTNLRWTSGAVRLLIVPLLREGTVLGAVMIEDARIDAPSRDLARACSALLALRASRQALPDVAVPAVPARSGAVQGTEPARLAATALIADEPSLLPDRVMMRAAALVLQLSDNELTHSETTVGLEKESRVVRLARAAGELAAAHGVPYARMLGGTIVAAAGLDEQSEAAFADAAARLADVALALRDQCLTLFGQEEGNPAFGLGLDIGSIQAARLGDSPATLNMWGEAFGSARILAETAQADSIQAGEHAYLLLRQHFVFRQRGVFHRPGLGDANCYVLAGHA